MKKNFLLLAVGLLLLAGCKEQEQKERDDTFVVTFINEYKEMPSSAQKRFLKSYGFESSTAARFYCNGIVATPEFYERTESDEAVWGNYHQVVDLLENRFVEEYRKSLKNPLRRDSVHKDDDIDIPTVYNVEKIKIIEETAENTFSQEVSKKYWELRRNFSELEKRRFVHYLASEQWQSIIEQCVLVLNQKFLELYDKDKGEGAKWLFDKYILHSLYEEYQKYVPLDSYYLYGRKDTEYQLAAYRDAFKTHPNASAENSKYYATMKKEFEALKMVSGTDWKLYWMAGEGRISDADCGVERVLKTNDYGFLYNEKNRGIYYFKDGKLVMHSDMDFVLFNDLPSIVEGTFELDKDKDGKNTLTWRATETFIRRGWRTNAILKFRE